MIVLQEVGTLFKLIFLTLLALFGYRVEPTPARLNRKLSNREKINLWVYRHQYELLLLLTILVIVVFVLALIMFFPAMDNYNNRFQEVI